MFRRKLFLFVILSLTLLLVACQPNLPKTIIDEVKNQHQSLPDHTDNEKSISFDECYKNLQEINESLLNEEEIVGDVEYFIDYVNEDLDVLIKNTRRNMTMDPEEKREILTMVELVRDNVSVLEETFELYNLENLSK